jgi:hypothetical protein
LARYYEVDDKERNSIGYPDGEINRWKKSDTPSMRPLSQTEIDWKAYQEIYGKESQAKRNFGENKFKFEWKVPKFLGDKTMLEIGGTPNKPIIKENWLEREKFSGSLRVSGIAEISSKVNVGKDGKPLTPRRSYYNQEFYYKNNTSFQRTMESPELNQAGISRGIAATKSVEILGIINNNVPLAADLYYEKTKKQLSFRDKLERANNLETKYPVPPKPENLPEERKKLTRLYGNDVKGKMQVNELMKKMEVASHAFWNR